MTIRVEPGTELPLRPSESAATEPAESAAVDGPDFARVLERGIVDANKAQLVAEQRIDALARGASDDLHGTMISVKEAEISMKLVGSVRNKLLDAFHELWRINL